MGVAGRAPHLPFCPPPLWMCFCPPLGGWSTKMLEWEGDRDKKPFQNTNVNEELAAKRAKGEGGTTTGRLAEWLAGRLAALFAFFEGCECRMGGEMETARAVYCFFPSSHSTSTPFFANAPPKKGPPKGPNGETGCFTKGTKKKDLSPQ